MYTESSPISLKEATRISEERTGGTYHLQGLGRLSPESGYWASYSGYETSIPAPSGREIHDTARDLSAILTQDGHHRDALGVWVKREGGLWWVVFDRSRWFPNRSAAEAFAKAHNQEAIWDIAAGEAITLAAVAH